jgi:hypothetical protein
VGTLGAGVLAVGMEDGAVVGAFVGAAVGLRVGMAVGQFVGSSVGATSHWQAFMFRHTMILWSMRCSLAVSLLQ